MSFKKIRPYLLLVLLIIIGAANLYWFIQKHHVVNAITQLHAQGIAVSRDNFIAEIEAGHKDNIKFFINCGGHAAMWNSKGISALSAAMATGDPEIADMIIATLPQNPVLAKKVVNGKGIYGITALVVAVERNDPVLVQKLLAAGADPALSGKSLRTPLIIAIRHKFEALLEPLIRADITLHGVAGTVNASDVLGKTPLAYAVAEQSESMVKILLDAHANAVSANDGGTTPLMLAAEAGNVAIGKMFVSAGAKPDVADAAGKTPLTIAITYSHPEFAEFLVEAGANVDFHTNGPSPLEIAIDKEPFDYPLIRYLMTHSKEKETATPALLFKAVDHKNMDVVRELLAQGTSPKIADSKGATLLYHAIESGDEDIALLLIDKGADISKTGINGTTILERATLHDEGKVVSKLLSLGVSPDQKTSGGYTIAEMAVYQGYPDVLEVLFTKGARIEKNFSILWSIRDGGGRAVPVLLAHGANPNVMNENGDPALWLAASANETDAVKALIKYHADINYPNKAQGMTPLVIASHAGQLAAVKLLVEAGAKLEMKDGFGMTALAHAAFMTKPDVVEYLISKGADIHATDSEGRSIADLAGIASASVARNNVLKLLQKK